MAHKGKKGSYKPAKRRKAKSPRVNRKSRKRR